MNGVADFLLEAELKFITFIRSFVPILTQTLANFVTFVYFSQLLRVTRSESYKIAKLYEEVIHFVLF